MEVKQVIVVRRKYPHPTKEGEMTKIRTGKIVAQACHASLKVFFDRMHRIYFGGNADDYDWEVQMTPEMEIWKDGNFKKVCVYVDTEVELHEVYTSAIAAGIVSALITDSGLTEFNGVPTVTCCAIGPAMSSKIDVITGELPLL